MWQGKRRGQKKEVPAESANLTSGIKLTDEEGKCLLSFLFLLLSLSNCREAQSTYSSHGHPFLPAKPFQLWRGSIHLFLTWGMNKDLTLTVRKKLTLIPYMGNEQKPYLDSEKKKECKLQVHIKALICIPTQEVKCYFLNDK